MQSEALAKPVIVIYGLHPKPEKLPEILFQPLAAVAGFIDVEFPMSGVAKSPIEQLLSGCMQHGMSGNCVNIALL